MPELIFPTDQAVGTLDWDGAFDPARGPVLAIGTASAPEGIEISLEVSPVGGSEAVGGGTWRTETGTAPVDLTFLARLPADSITSLSLGRIDPATIGSIEHLAPGLRRLYLPWTGLDDDALPHITRLTGLRWLQTFGNHFTDGGVQQLAVLRHLEHPYLEEATLTAAAFTFTALLPHLAQLGLQDVQIGPGELDALKARLPGSTSAEAQ
jgi:hypothetical protein